MSAVHAGVTLLPGNRTPFETALSLTSADFRAIDADAIRRAFDPWACPPHLLPWLAHAFSVDYWEPDWPEVTQRRAIARAVRLHFIKGTLAATREIIDFAGGRLIRAVTPPARTFCGPSLTRNEREAWLSRLPQVRVWRVAERRAAGGVFSGGPLIASIVGGRHFRPNTAPTRSGRRARWVVGGVEQPARAVEIPSGGFQVFLPSTSDRAVFCGRAMRARYFRPSSAAQRIVSIAPTFSAAWRSAVGPRLEPVTAEPELVRERGTRGGRVFSGTVMRRAHFHPPQAWRRLFERYAVHDGQAVDRRPARQFMGVERFGARPHTAELVVSLRGTRGPGAAGEGILTPRTRFWRPHNPKRLDAVCRALTATKRASDRLVLRFPPAPGITAGRPFLAGMDRFVIGRASRQG